MSSTSNSPGPEDGSDEKNNQKFDSDSESTQDTNQTNDSRNSEKLPGVDSDLKRFEDSSGSNNLRKLIDALRLGFQLDKPLDDFYKKLITLASEILSETVYTLPRFRYVDLIAKLFGPTTESNRRLKSLVDFLQEPESKRKVHISYVKFDAEQINAIIYTLKYSPQYVRLKEDLKSLQEHIETCNGLENKHEIQKYVEEYRLGLEEQVKCKYTNIEDLKAKFESLNLKKVRASPILASPKSPKSPESPKSPKSPKSPESSESEKKTGLDELFKTSHTNYWFYCSSGLVAGKMPSSIIPRYGPITWLHLQLYARVPIRVVIRNDGHGHDSALYSRSTWKLSSDDKVKQGDVTFHNNRQRAIELALSPLEALYRVCVFMLNNLITPSVYAKGDVFKSIKSAAESASKFGVFTVEGYDLCDLATRKKCLYEYIIRPRQAFTDVLNSIKEGPFDVPTTDSLNVYQHFNENDANERMKQVLTDPKFAVNPLLDKFEFPDDGTGIVLDSANHSPHTTPDTDPNTSNIHAKMEQMEEYDARFDQQDKKIMSLQEENERIKQEYQKMKDDYIKEKQNSARLHKNCETLEQANIQLKSQLTALEAKLQNFANDGVRLFGQNKAINTISQAAIAQAEAVDEAVDKNVDEAVDEAVDKNVDEAVDKNVDDKATAGTNKVANTKKDASSHASTPQ